MKKQTFFNALILLALLVFYSCAGGGSHEGHDHGHHDSVQQEQKVSENDDCDDAHWEYSGENAPENWGHLCPGFSPCNGKAQSPVDIVDAKEDESLPEIKVSYEQESAEIVNNGHTVQFNIEGDNQVTIGDKTYELLQFHFHALSEHKIQGEHYPLEVHLVHRLSDSELGVIGVMYKEGAENAFLAKFLDQMPEEKTTVSVDKTYNPTSVLPANLDYYHYSGSLTTPPCSEIVSWYVLKKPIEASQEQLEQFAAILNDNYRPVQQLNGREILATP